MPQSILQNKNSVSKYFTIQQSRMYNMPMTNQNCSSTESFDKRVSEVIIFSETDSPTPAYVKDPLYKEMVKLGYSRGLKYDVDTVLGELGRHPIIMWKAEKTWVAGLWRYGSKLYIDDYPTHRQEGKTPLEAISRLFINIKTKGV